MIYHVATYDLQPYHAIMALQTRLYSEATGKGGVFRTFFHGWPKGATEEGAALECLGSHKQTRFCNQPI